MKETSEPKADGGLARAEKQSGKIGNGCGPTERADFDAIRYERTRSPAGNAVRAHLRKETMATMKKTEKGGGIMVMFSALVTLAAMSVAVIAWLIITN